MNKTYTAVVLVILTLFIFSDIRATTNFPTDKTTFFEELHEFMGSKSNKEFAALVNQVESKVLSGKVGENGFEEMVAICNKMAELKMRPSPYYKNYLHVLNKIESNDIRNWHNLLIELLAITPRGKLKPYNTFLDFSSVFFENRFLRKSTSGISWKMESVDFQMLWKDNQPVLDFEKSSLTAERKGKKITIINASGTFLPLEKKWVGRGGKVTWKRLDENSEISANLLDYSIDLTKNAYSAQKAYLTYPKYFSNKVIEGEFHDKLLIGNQNKGASFPRFQSKSGNINLKNIAQGVNFTGGIKLSGLTITGYNPEDENAFLEYNSEKFSKKVKLKASSFSIKNSGEIIAFNSASTMFFGEDSLYHPSINVKLVPGKKMTLYSGNHSATKSPYYDSRQGVYFYAKKIIWEIENNSVLINPRGGGDRAVRIESEDFYDKNFVHRIQNSSNHQPIILLYLMSKEDGNRIDANYYAKRLNPNFTISNIKNLLFDLERKGFFRYLSEKGELVLTGKVAHYAESHGRNKDFDILKIDSRTGESNAVYDLDKGEFVVSGVERVILQNRQTVAFKPTSETVTLKEGRQIDFSGKIYSGKINLTGKDCHFDYQNFRIKIDSLEFFDIYLPSDSTYEFEDQKSYGIGSRIEETSGYLLVNAPDNKSGKEELDEYPAFQSEAPSFVYYDNENKQGDVYQRKNFFFELEPFKLKNLAKPKPSDLTFKGNFVSGGIFPAFKEDLVLQKDQSLGFVSKTPQDGYPIYNETGEFQGKIELSNEGLLGSGNLTYSGTNIDSEDLVFQPKKVTGSADFFHLKEDKENSVPEVKGYDVNIDWKPYEDSMIVASKEKSFQLFNEGEHEIGGVLISTPTGLKGRGIFKWGEGEMGANLFDFGAHAVESEKTNLKIKSMETDALAFDTKDLKGSINFDTKKGQFKSNDEKSKTKMPANYFETTLNEFEWDLGKKALTFVAEQGKTGQFNSTHPDQDSLSFEGKTANYDFETGLLKIEGVKTIEVSDAYIIPDKNKVKVATGGFVQKLENAQITADRVNQYHKFTNATVTILGKHSYEATGDYEYKVGNLVQSISFSKITGKKRGKGKRSERISSTEAHKIIGEPDEFKLDARTFFYGDIELKAGNPFLQFTGYSKLDAPMLAKANWFRVDFEGDKNNLLIASDKPKSPAGVHLYTGIFINKESQANYSGVLMPKKHKDDRSLFDANGVFKFDEVQNRFVLGNADKMANGLSKGNLLYFSQKDAEIKAVGSFNICPNIRGAKVQLTGVAKTGLEADKLNDSSLSNESLKGDFAAKLDFRIPKTLMDIIEKDFLTYKDSVKSIQYRNGELYRTAITDWVENSNYKNKALKEYNLNKTIRIREKKKPATFILGELKMKWHSEKQSFVSTSDSVALISLNGKEFNKKVKALVVFNTPDNEDDRVYVMLRTPANKYYYFNYKKGIMHVQSNNQKFNDKIKSMTSKDLTSKLKEGGSYEVQLTTSEIVGGFRRNIERWKSEL